MATTRREMVEQGRLAARCSFHQTGLVVHGPKMKRDDYPAGVTDALTNLMHFCDIEDVDFATCLAEAAETFAVESGYTLDEQIPA